MAKAAAKGPARDAGYWRARVAALREQRAEVAARCDALVEERIKTVLEAPADDAAAARRIERLVADYAKAELEGQTLEAAISGAEKRLAGAEAAEAEADHVEHRSRRDAVLSARADNARRAEELITALGDTLAEMRAQAEAIMEMTAGRDTAETLKPIKTDHRLQLAMARAGFTWRDRQGAAHPLFPDAPAFAEAEIEAQAAYAARDVR